MKTYTYAYDKDDDTAGAKSTYARVCINNNNNNTRYYIYTYNISLFEPRASHDVFNWLNPPSRQKCPGDGRLIGEPVFVLSAAAADDVYNAIQITQRARTHAHAHI